MATPQLDPADLDPGAREDEAALDPMDYLRYALGAVGRRKRLVLVTFLAGLALLTAFYLVRPPLYRAETRILAQRQQSLPSIVRSSVGEDQPTRAAWELIHRRDNLLDLLKLAGLTEAPPRQSGPPGVLDRAIAWLDRSLASDDDPLEALLLLLDKRLKVEAGEVTIAIELDWGDPQQAYRIVDGALQNFLEARHVQEVTALDEAIAVLQGRAAVLRAELTRVTEETRRVILQDAARAPRAPAQVAPVPTSLPGSEELVRLRSMLEAKERAIGDVEEFRRRRLAELQAQYDARRSVYAEAHPELVGLRQDIAALTRDSSQITALRADERRLREDYQARLAREPAPPSSAPAFAEVSPRSAYEGINAAVEQSERVRDARTRYQEIMASVNGAQLELDAARAAFKHRYKVIWPVQVPKRPVSPNPLKIFGVGGLAALLLALLAAVALDWRSGKVMERWQIERELNLPILGQTRRER
jgi:uncharacterized protein involved in exopolysaccharide biosynthesis